MSERRLVLLRHAKAEPGHDLDSDELRPLAPKGRDQAGGVGKAFGAAGLAPQVALVSTALRTRQTWDLLAKKLGGAPPELRLEPELYLASVADVLELVRALGDTVTTVLVVGHEPTMAATAAHLAGPGSDDAALAQVRVGVPTAAWSVLESDEDWRGWGRGKARLLSVSRPS
ncbi:putative phosphohistidine phosphatase, SixA [Xylanimonas cellulosilytica DSM 15894]|uniref:Phosphohistidine phosphatase, SixA n=1 Tax=Xylanimonas cellulosilytica (strain DSM 15894 / JCM 12276 / CECT 5975 / KCTC 9989 / LMG 20990 / NBRC 107835 / XIL07) TaxID=446471 RepID=D1BRJ4_XYLCX|nr:histidine phosphatase family protein [Xylanimonas cellulosilytica]ACZ30449.1 putative phosphohistidine phosphatase, SixA [Xylanimonas cellulosilytica DSM 15894]